MRLRYLARQMAAGLATAALLQAQLADAESLEVVPQPGMQATIAPYIIAPGKEPALTQAQEVALLRRHVRYVFVLYQENRSFDSYFGTFPGADGLYSQPASATPGFTQPIMNLDGSTGSIQPFRIGPAQFAADTDDIDHSHPATFFKIDVKSGQPMMDRFALWEEQKHAKKGPLTLAAKQFGELAMAHEDCDTIPILWRYADRFTLMDHVFENMSGPSTPGNLTIFAAQSGATQLALHPTEAWKTAADIGEPVINDADPYWGSPRDPSQGKTVPVNPKDFSGKKPEDVQLNQTYATLALTTAGAAVKAKTARDSDAADDLADVTDDVSFIQALHRHEVAWRWFQEGYGDDESPSAGPTDAVGRHAGYVTHHNGPQYFGYVANNPAMRQNLQDLSAFFSAVRNHALPAAGGVFYVKGGDKNSFGLRPEDPDPKVQKEFLGDDDHPAYSDSGISQSLLARTVNAIAASPYWGQSAIIITWDDSEGDYDHVQPPLTLKAPDGSYLGEGPRVPLLVISPYARAHEMSHQLGSQSSVVKFVDAVFGLPPLASLPDERKGLALGQKEFGQAGMGPADGESNKLVGDLLPAFDPARLSGAARPLPASYAEVPDGWATELPAQSGASCKAIGMVPVDIAMGIANKIPADFNPRPKTDPTGEK